MSESTALEQLLHQVVCAIELGIMGHVDGSNESPHDGEHPHPWPCERMAAGFREKNLHLSAANFRADGPHAFFLDPETGDEWPIDSEPLDVERLAGALDVLSDEGLEYDLMAPEEREERYEAAERVAASYYSSGRAA